MKGCWGASVEQWAHGYKLKEKDTVIPKINDRIIRYEVKVLDVIYCRYAHFVRVTGTIRQPYFEPVP